jgi:hypothetical protein
MGKVECAARVRKVCLRWMRSTSIGALKTANLCLSAWIAKPVIAALATLQL